MSEKLNLNPERDSAKYELRKQLAESTENYVKDKAKNYQGLYEKIVKFGPDFAPVAKTIDNLGNESVAIDQVKYENLYNYIDERFSTEDDVNNNPDAREQYREAYLKSINAKANLLSDSLTSIRHSIINTDNNSLEDLVTGVNITEDKLPDSELALANAYLEYFDNPSEEMRKKLDYRYKDYDSSMRRSFGVIGESVSDERIFGNGLAEASGKFCHFLVQDYDATHYAILDYFDHEYDLYQSTHGDVSSEQEPAPQTPIKNAPDAPRSSEKLDVKVII